MIMNAILVIRQAELVGDNDTWVVGYAFKICKV